LVFSLKRPERFSRAFFVLLRTKKDNQRQLLKKITKVTKNPGEKDQGQPQIDTDAHRWDTDADEDKE